MKHFVDQKDIDNIFNGKATPAEIDKLAAKRFEGLTQLITDLKKKDEKNYFAPTNSVLANTEKKFDLNEFTPTGTVKTGQTKKGGTELYDYKEYKSKNKFKFVQLKWVKHTDHSTGDIKKTTDGRQEGHFIATPMEDHITIGVDTYQISGKVEVSHLVPSDQNSPAVATDNTGTPLKTLSGEDPYKYILNPSGGKGTGKGGSGK